MIADGRDGMQHLAYLTLKLQNPSTLCTLARNGVRIDRIACLLPIPDVESIKNDMSELLEKLYTAELGWETLTRAHAEFPADISSHETLAFTTYTDVLSRGYGQTQNHISHQTSFIPGK